MSSQPSSDPLPLSVSPTNLSESLSSETQSPPEPQTPSAPQSLPISQHPAASSGSTALHLDTLGQSTFDEAPLHQPDQSLVLNFQDPSPERLHSPVPPSALPRFTRPTPLPRFLSRPPAIEPSTSELVLALRALVRPQEPSLERILPHLRPLKSFADPWDFLEALNRTFSTLSVPEDAFGKLLVWTLSTDSPGLADFIESQYPHPDSFTARPSWKSIQASLLDRVEGPGSQQRRLTQLLALRPSPGMSLADFGDSFRRAAARSAHLFGTPSSIDPIEVFADALPPAARSVFNTIRTLSPPDTLENLVHKSSMVLGNQPMLQPPPCPIIAIQPRTLDPHSPGSLLAPPPPNPALTSDPGRPARGESPTARHARLQYRRDNNLCLVCGSPDHFLVDCPLRREKTPNKADTLYFVPLVQADVRSSRSVAPVSMLLDTGAGGVFVSQTLADLLQCERRSTRHSIDTAVLGSPIPVTQLTTITIDWRDTSVTLNALIVPGLAYDVVAGTPFLSMVGATFTYSPDHPPQITPGPGPRREQPASAALSIPAAPPPHSTLSILSEHSRETPVTSHPFARNSTGSNVADLLALLPSEYHDLIEAFDESKTDRLPPSRSFDMEIRLSDESASLPDSRMYRLCTPERAALKKWIEDCLERGHIRRSKSPAGAGIFFVKKKDKSLRLCIDYRLLNRMTIANRFPLPLPDALLDRIFAAGPCVFTKIDLKSSFNLLCIRESDRWKTAFKCEFGHFEMQVMPFGLKNAPATWQAYVESIFPRSFASFMLVYIDDILVFSDSLDDHVSHVRSVLKILAEQDLVASFKKCSFSTQQVEFLGFLLSTEGIAMDPAKTKAINEWSPPHTAKGVQGFIGFCNFYRRFIPQFSNMATPLHDACTRKPFALSQAALDSFNRIKQSFSRALSLTRPDFAKPFYIFGDASEYGLGAGLHQVRDKVDPDDFSCPTPEDLVPLSFFSRKLLPAELNYDTPDKELLVIREALEYWRPWLRATMFPTRFFSDHKNLENFTCTTKLSARVLRWQKTFDDFDFRVVFLPGTQMVVADALSRKGEYRPSKNELDLLRSAARLNPAQFAVVNLLAVSSSGASAPAPAHVDLPVIASAFPPLHPFPIDQIWDSIRADTASLSSVPHPKSYVSRCNLASGENAPTFESNSSPSKSQWSH